MALESHTGIGGRHTVTVVNHLDERTPGILEHYRDFCGTCIHSILYEFLYHGSRSLYHLSGRNLVRHRIR